MNLQADLHDQSSLKIRLSVEPKSKGVAAVLLVTSGRLRSCDAKFSDFAPFGGRFPLFDGACKPRSWSYAGRGSLACLHTTIIWGCLMNVLNHDTRFLNRLFAVSAPQHVRKRNLFVSYGSVRKQTIQARKVAYASGVSNMIRHSKS